MGHVMAAKRNPTDVEVIGLSAKIWATHPLYGRVDYYNVHSHEPPKRQCDALARKWLESGDPRAKALLTEFKGL
jgi:hypothetical protein